MHSVTWRKKLLTVFSLIALPLAACAQPGMMGGQQPYSSDSYAGPGYGYGPGYGMGPGMMYGGGGGPGGGYGWGPGMMGGYGMGPGMMYGWGGPGGGYGWGPGMMGGYGMGPGMMYGWGGPGGGYGGYGLYGLDLTDKQRSQIDDIHEQARKRQFELGQKMYEEQAKLGELYRSEKPDPKQVGQVYGNLAKLQQQMAEIHTETQNRVLDTLTKEQREQLQQWRNQMWGAGPGGGYGPGWRYQNR